MDLVVGIGAIEVDMVVVVISVKISIHILLSPCFCIVYFHVLGFGGMLMQCYKN
jgi:hypothetical protein